ncbi:MAG: hypothetical protein RIQ72_315 [Candidatus Parcubacteria bacterium]
MVPPNLVVIFQAESAHQFWVRTPLSNPGVNKVEGIDYLLSSNATNLQSQLTPETQLLIIGSDRGSVTEPLQKLVAKARELNPGVRVVSYAGTELQGIDTADFIQKGSHLAAERFVMEVAHAIDMARNAERAGEVFST